MCVLKSLLSVCFWGYEASLLFPGQLLVTQEWLICNGCCHSAAVAPGDGCTVINAHAYFQPENTHNTEVYTHVDALTLIHLHTKNHPFLQYGVSTSDKLSSSSHQSSRRWQIDKWSWRHPVILADWIWPTTALQCSCISLSVPLSVFLFWKLKWNQATNALHLFLPPEHSGGGEVHPGSNEPDARPECLLQPVPGDGLWQAKGVQGDLQHSVQVKEAEASSTHIGRMLFTGG